MAGLLAGRSALVVGASSGIGSAIALRLGDEGARVVVASRRENEASAVVDAITAAGGIAGFMQVDVGSTAAVSKLLEDVVSEHGVSHVAPNESCNARYKDSHVHPTF